MKEPHVVSAENLTLFVREYAKTKATREGLQALGVGGMGLEEYFSGKHFAQVDTFAILFGLEWGAAFDQLQLLAKELPDAG